MKSFGRARAVYFAGLVVVVCIILWVAGYLSGGRKFHETSVRLDGASAAALRVVDGDTVALGNERIRLMGFDAAETHRPRCAKERALGERAKRRLSELIRSSDIILKRHGRDRYGRTLAKMLVGGRDVAGVMIAEGLARPNHGERRRGWCRP